MQSSYNFQNTQLAPSLEPDPYRGSGSRLAGPHYMPVTIATEKFNSFEVTKSLCCINKLLKIKLFKTVFLTFTVYILCDYALLIIIIKWESVNQN